MAISYKNVRDEEEKDKIYISDLEMMPPIKSFFKKDNIYGVIPFMASEILPYTQARNIYSFSMISTYFRNIIKEWIFILNEMNVIEELKSNIIELINT
ncbi:hypothetical protein C1646_764462 [Rhizophagus diaphanus]|nr:hypothetical protein C1646_764462 [Rhizophagus diaphanus] [Rhizophagus sp. MUCL 43196]